MFAGIGGFRAGLTRAGGFQCVGHCEIDKYADKSYRAMHNIRDDEFFCADAKTLKSSEIPPFDLICAGFPCQPFSTSGRRFSFKDARGKLFFEIARIAEDRKPPYLLMENVPGLLHAENGGAFSVILSTLNDIGYVVEWMVLNSAAFGVPQVRKRVFMFACRDIRCAGKVFPVFGTEAKPLLQMVGGKQGYRVYNPGGPACTQTSGGGGGGAKTGLYFIDLTAGHPKETELARCLTAQYGKTSLSNHQGERSGVLVIRETGNAETSSGDGVKLQYESGSGNRTRIGRIRRLMPRECLRLQGFDEDQIDRLLAVMSEAQAYRQGGNSVTVNVIEAIGRKIRAMDEALRQQDAEGAAA